MDNTKSDGFDATYDEELESFEDGSPVNTPLPGPFETVKTSHHAGFVPFSPNAPVNVWPNMAFLCHTDLAWLIHNQANIVRARRARHMEKVRPIKAWPNGRVRVEFVGTWPSAPAARAELEPLFASLATRPKEADHV